MLCLPQEPGGSLDSVWSGCPAVLKTSPLFLGGENEAYITWSESGVSEDLHNLRPYHRMLE